MKISFSSSSAFLASAVVALSAQANPAAGQRSPAAAAAAPTNAPAAAAPAITPAEMTAEGTIKKLVAKKKEIYVIPNGSDKKLEFYFPENAQFLKNNQPVNFDALKEGQKVRVTYTQKGKRLNPTKAEILE